MSSIILSTARAVAACTQGDRLAWGGLSPCFLSWNAVHMKLSQQLIKYSFSSISRLSLEPP